MSTYPNNNWTTCDECESLRMIEPASGEPEPCTDCRSMASPVATVVGIVALLTGAAAIAGLVALSISILL